MTHLPPSYLWHPIAVHFPLALLSTGAGFGLVWVLLQRPAWAADTARWLLWIGTLAAWAAMGLGLLAEDTVPHVPDAWQAMNTHRHLAFWTVGVFTVLSLWRFVLQRWGGGVQGKRERWFLVAWAAALGVLFATGYFGGELVFTHGVGYQQDN